MCAIGAWTKLFDNVTVCFGEYKDLDYYYMKNGMIDWLTDRQTWDDDAG